LAPMNNDRARAPANAGARFLGPMAVAALAILALGAAGCLWLGAGELAYNYEKTGSITGIPASSQSSAKKTTKSPAAQPTPADTDIE